MVASRSSEHDSMVELYSAIVRPTLTWGRSLEEVLVFLEPIVNSKFPISVPWNGMSFTRDGGTSVIGVTLTLHASFAALV